MRRRVVHVYTHWIVKCGWCGKHAPIATDGRNLFCNLCGH
jgi:hypothetical protein